MPGKVTREATGTGLHPSLASWAVRCMCPQCRACKQRPAQALAQQVCPSAGSPRTVSSRCVQECWLRPGLRRPDTQQGTRFQGGKVEQDSSSRHTGEPGRGALLVPKAGPGGGRMSLWKAGGSRTRMTAGDGWAHPCGSWEPSPGAGLPGGVSRAG